MDGIELLGYAAGLLVVISLLPQIIQIWKTKSTRDISLGRYLIYSMGLALWIAYALLISSLPLAVMGTIELLLALSVLYLKLKHG